MHPGRKELFFPMLPLEQVEKFSLGDFTDMLSYQGLMVESVFGDYDLNAYHVKKSPRMIITAKKIH